MIPKSWPLQGQEPFQRSVEHAIKEGAQAVTKHGKPAVLVISVKDYEKSDSPRWTLIRLLRKCPEDLTKIIGTHSNLHFDP